MRSVVYSFRQNLRDYLTTFESFRCPLASRSLTIYYNLYTCISMEKAKLDQPQLLTISTSLGYVHFSRLLAPLV